MTAEMNSQDQSIHFPLPFGGIEATVEGAQIEDLIEALQECGHLHNFAVELDHNQPRVWVSAMGAECIRAALTGSPPEYGELLSQGEQQLIKLIAQVWNRFCSVVGDGPTRSADLQEIAGKIHDLQHAVMAQAAARAHPETYRLLGRHEDWMQS